MPRIDESTQVRRRLDALTGPEPPADSERTHPARWDEEAIAAASHDAHDSAESSTPPWLSEPCGSVSFWHDRLVPERFRGTRWDPGPRGALIIAAIGVVAVLLAGYVSLREEPVSQPVPPIAVAGETIPADPPPADGTADSNPDALKGAPPAARDAAGTHNPQPVDAPNAPLPSRNPVGANVPGAASPGTTTAPGAGAPLGGATAPGGAAQPGSAVVVVSVVGYVEHGGLRRFAPGARVADALRAAAPRPEADLSGLNLAQQLCDGDQIVIARTTTRPNPQQQGSTVVNAARPTAADPAVPTTSARPTTPPAKVNLNTATEAELDSLPGVGPSTARAILAWRTRHGRFTSIDQLSEIEGIGHSRLARLRPAVTL
ncbi:helix-hairpin-helix domain-containing protein [Nocardia sp. NPDC020380]|uniref:helix-hairpin-helix domain-containing protein n=1 Tax=Nocardia sp. NPDC020380 TaxID=3364309 RepID=UPI0037B15EC8